MDGVALASVISSAAVGLGTLGLSWSTRRQTAELTREGREQARLEKAYLEVLQYAEREGMALQAQARNVELSVLDEYQSVRRHAVERPDRYQRASASALLRAFGSKQSQQAMAAWIESVESVDDAFDALSWNASESGNPDDYAVRDDELARLKARAEAEAAGRSALAAALAGELRNQA